MKKGGVKGVGDRHKNNKKFRGSVTGARIKSPVEWGTISPRTGFTQDTFTCGHCKVIQKRLALTFECGGGEENRFPIPRSWQWGSLRRWECKGVGGPLKDGERILKRGIGL